ncbi:3-hydroxyacyl-CoA dehydrogenase NAD-binding domain-containing protein [Naumannella halotolerans]|uniref:3-hydroxyacyl-CoA dehydrogenase/enoyl-CoA hydratase/3-hydroxybutyryl-CoA epimerase n=1 Tax=Naumannella halotolerans TaxID=993414 RepID=A0A4V3EMU6_9ACTN|nr:3-hydroxyacyl-CoA dehydrogenase NAD-binding domain-containing protein [Naumannella halotolerans]TDT30928.1 3-hydroxyacyl-CoA dehydrogenase/enoyl-CoA hydratase/3-hydroxybutyryl-CoA epimerase [Naumannella halotolerans]
MTGNDNGSADRPAVRVELGEDRIAELILDDPGASANTMNDRYRTAMHAAVNQLASVDDLAGVIITSAKSTFFAGANLKELHDPESVDALDLQRVESLKADLRKLETLGVPVVAVLGGAALGGGLEIALAAHRRIAVDNPRSVFGLPEVTLGLLPGGGGVTRVVRMLGILDALLKVLGEGRRFKPAEALEVGLIDELQPDAESALAAARQWIADNPESAQPWDRPGYKLPGGTPSNPKFAAIAPSLPANLVKQLKGAPMPAPRAILAAAYEGAQVDFDTASRIESRYLISLIKGPVSKNMVQAFFLDLQTISKGGSRPGDSAPHKINSAGVLGAGMMGAGIAYSLARSGIEVVLKDVDLAAAEKGKAYSQKLLDKQVGRGKLTQQQADQVLARITPSAEAADLAGVDALIEAVFEDQALKHQVFAEALAHVRTDTLLCSNTSTLPITGLAAGVDRPADFVGLHFFSPVDKMPLVEIIRGEQTSDETVARAYDLTLQIRKTPIVVNDSRGFYTSRVISTMVNEGLAMLAEGVHPVSIECAATQAGYPVGPLQLTDELNMELLQRIRTAYTDSGAEQTSVETASGRVLETMINAGRPSRKAGAGFYSYDEAGKRGKLWPGLWDTFGVAEQQPPFADLQDRFLFTEALETQRCFDEGVLTSTTDANIGSIMGIGYPAWTGGTAQFVANYPGGRDAFLARAGELAEAYGDHFRPPSSLTERVAATV